MSPIKRIWDSWNTSSRSASRSATSPANMPGIISTPGETVDLTIDDSDDEQSTYGRVMHTTGNSPAANAVPQPVSTSPHAAQHQSGRKGPATTTTPSKSAAGARTFVGSASRQNVSPRSTRLSQHHAPDASSPLNMPGHNASSSRGPMPHHATPMRGTTKQELEFDVDKIAAQLKSFSAEIDKASGRLLRYTFRSIIKDPPKRRHVDVVDHFADMPSIALEPGSVTEDSLRIQLKLHFASDKPPRKKNVWFPQTVLNQVKPAVPKYRFHHVEINKNILTPNTQLRFIPFLRDLEVSEEDRFYKWLGGLKEQELEDGMECLALDSEDKKRAMARMEHAAIVHAYLEYWINKLEIESLTRSALIHYMASETADDDTTMTPQQKSALLDSEAAGLDSPDSHAAAKAFTKAFDRVFGDRTSLRDVLMLDAVVESLLTDKKVKESSGGANLRDEELLRDLENVLATYALFNCLICFSYDCEHGSLDENRNVLNRFSISNNARLAAIVRKMWIEQTKKKPEPEAGSVAVTPCKNDCFQGPHPAAPAPAPWRDDETKLLKIMFATLSKSTLKPECAAATILGRKCWDVHDKLASLNLSLPYTALPPEQPRAKNMPWYDRTKKTMTIDTFSPEYTVTSEACLIEIVEPCHHEGPCSPANKCACALAKHLCERFCLCSADTCPYKFTGCACHATGKSCVDKKCICYQLNRECDPVLCSGCGAAERANRLNMHNDALHATGCQNVALQRGVSKALLMGASQLEGCGYGLFAAEDIARDEFVIEYTGEMIRAGEGVRREARRGNVFDEASNTSYLFTLLDTEGIWVDAAIYGNLSRYINHAGDGDKRGANITPKIVYVMGEYRIRFTATRDIKTGEELFFNYGDNFPNLTKKLLEDKDAEAAGRRKTGPKRKPGRPPSKTAAGKGKGKEVNFAPPSKRAGRPRARGGATKTAPSTTRNLGADEMDWEASEAAATPTEDEDPLAEDDDDEEASTARRRRRGGLLGGRIPPLPEDADDYDEYRPTGGQEDLAAYTLARDRRRRSRAATAKRAAASSAVGGGSKRSAAAAANSDDGGGGSSFKTPTPTPTPKKNSNRGGARPGAGRKPKKPPTPPAKKKGKKTAAVQNKSETSASASQDREVEEVEEEEEEEEEEIEDSYMAGEDEEDSDDVPVERGRGTTKTTYSLRTRGSAKKRKSSERDDSDDGREQYGDVSELRAEDDGQEGDGDGEEDSDDVIDRSRRKRQKPARYRADE